MRFTGLVSHRNGRTLHGGASQSVCGSAPIRMNSAVAGNVLVVPPVLSSRVSASSRLVPWTAATSVCSRTMTLPARSNSPTR